MIGVVRVTYLTLVSLDGPGNLECRQHTVRTLVEQATTGTATAADTPPAAGMPAAAERPLTVERVTAGYDRKIARYRAALDAGADPVLVGGWINQTQAERDAALARARPATPAQPGPAAQPAQLVPSGRAALTVEEITDTQFSVTEPEGPAPPINRSSPSPVTPSLGGRLGVGRSSARRLWPPVRCRCCAGRRGNRAQRLGR